MIKITRKTMRDICNHHAPASQAEAQEMAYIALRCIENIEQRLAIVADDVDEQQIDQIGREIIEEVRRE